MKALAWKLALVGAVALATAHAELPHQKLVELFDSGTLPSLSEIQSTVLVGRCFDGVSDSPEAGFLAVIPLSKPDRGPLFPSTGAQFTFHLMLSPVTEDNFSPQGAADDLDPGTIMNDTWTPIEAQEGSLVSRVFFLGEDNESTVNALRRNGAYWILHNQERREIQPPPFRLTPRLPFPSYPDIPPPPPSHYLSAVSFVESQVEVTRDRYCYFFKRVAPPAAGVN